jgi:hypothetical protein
MSSSNKSGRKRQAVAADLVDGDDGLTSAIQNLLSLKTNQLTINTNTNTDDGDGDLNSGGTDTEVS